MDLYHFTYPKYLRSILRHGLRPADGSASGVGNMTGGKKVVWLTTRPSLAPSRRAREMMLLRGIWVKPGGSNLPYATVCLRVKLAMHDKALKHWLRWARKQRGRDLIPPIDVDSPLVAEVCKHNWIYFGQKARAKGKAIC
jgi:hypothetical protein